MICPICGAEGGDTGICQNCGTPLTGTDWQDLAGGPIVQPGETPVPASDAGIPANPDDQAVATAAAAEQLAATAVTPAVAEQPIAVAEMPAGAAPTGVEATIPAAAGQTAAAASEPPVQEPAPAAQAFPPAQTAGVAPHMQPVSEPQPAQVATTQALPETQPAAAAEAPSPSLPTAAPVAADTPSPESAWGDGAAQPLPEQASGAAFVLVVVGLVLSILFVGCIPGLVCSIVGLVLHSRNEKAGKYSPRKSATKIVGIIGLVAGVLMSILFIATCVTMKGIVDEIDRNGWDYSRVEVVQDEDGMLVVREKRETDSGTSASASASASAATASSQSSQASSSTASTSSASSTSSSSSSSASASSQRNYDPACYDDAGNPTMYALLQLDGRNLQGLLESSGYLWTDEITSWMSRSGSLFCAIDRDGNNMSRKDIDELKAGAEGSATLYLLAIKGYATPREALSAITANVTVDDTHDSDESAFALVHGPSMVHYIVVASQTDTNEQTFLVYGETAVEQGVFKNTIGVDAGSTIEEVWDTITAS